MKKNKSADFQDNLLEKALSAFSDNKTKENYVRLLDAFHRTDILVPAAASDVLSLGDQGFSTQRPFKPEILFLPSVGKKVIPVFSRQSKIPEKYTGRKTVFMHSAGWINAFYTAHCDGVVLNPFSDLSFFLTPDQIRILSCFPKI